MHQKHTMPEHQTFETIRFLPGNLYQVTAALPLPADTLLRHWLHILWKTNPPIQIWLNSPLFWLLAYRRLLPAFFLNRSHGELYPKKAINEQNRPYSRKTQVKAFYTPEAK